MTYISSIQAMRRFRAGVTLIELLVVIAIIAILVGLLVPAVQKVRAAAANMKCKNNLKQWALAVHNYNDSIEHFPIGQSSSPRHTWVPYLWPFIEQTTSASLYGNVMTQQFYLPNATIAFTMNGACAVIMKQYYCPSDFGSNLDGPDNAFQRCRGNYVVNWGPNALGAVPNPLAPFGDIGGNPATPQTTTIFAITDGTSNTLLMSECLMAKSPNDDDWRGDIQNDHGEFCFTTVITPNSPLPDVIGRAWYVVNTDPLMPATAATGPTQYYGARSRHIGGVNASLCDGSVRFVSNSISLNTWQSSSTMNGGEVLGNDW